MGLGLSQGRALPDILRELGMVAEGVQTTRMVQTLAEREGLPMPITAALAHVLDGELDVHRAIAQLMAHPARAEVDVDHVLER